MGEAERASPYALRLAALTLELIERRGLSLEGAYSEARRRAGGGAPGALRLASLALRHFAKADLLLRISGLEQLPLRRRCAFRVAFAALAAGYELGGIDVGLLSGRLRSLLSRRGVERVEEELARLPPLERLSIEHSFPRWIVQEVSERLGAEAARRLVEACGRRVIWLRVNTLKASVGEVARGLRRQGVEVREDRDFDFLLELVGAEEVPDPVRKLFERGLAVVQDKGSVAVVHALGCARRMLVLDAAAAPGMKTSLLQQLSGNEAEVVAVDVSRRRLGEMRRLLSRLGVRGVRLVLSDSRLASFSRKFDKVLLDAPCTNSGAIPSDPALRLSLWRKPDLSRYASLQLEMLRNAAGHLKPGGTLVYSTCSLSAAEGEAVVDGAGLEGLDPEGVLGVPGYPGFSCSKKARRLFPHTHRTTGFFIARAVAR